MVAMVDETHPKLKKENGDDNEYTLGRIGVHNVVIACLPAGLMGNGPAGLLRDDITKSVVTHEKTETFEEYVGLLRPRNIYCVLLRNERWLTFKLALSERPRFFWRLTDTLVITNSVLLVYDDMLFLVVFSTYHRINTIVRNSEYLKSNVW